MGSGGSQDDQAGELHPGGRFARARALLAGPRATLVSLVAAAIVALPSLFAGLAADDYWHRIYLTHAARWAPALKPGFALFTFYDGDPARSQWLLDQGIGAWWADPALRISFLRPVSAVTHWLDYQLWPGTPLLMHAQSIAWFLLVVALAAALYRRTIGAGWAAGFAALLYALDHTHGTPVGWIANRNILVSGAFALAALWLYVQGRAGRRVAAWLSPLVLALALLAGEAALGITGYLAAYALFLDPSRGRRRAFSLAPHAAVVAAWAAIYHFGHYGVRGSGLYYDPLRSPLLFARHLPVNLSLLLAAELGAPTPDAYPLVSGSLQLALIAIAVGVLALAAFAIVPLVRRSAVARFFLLGAALAAVPISAVAPSARTLLLAGFGLIGLVALMVHSVVERSPALPSRRALRAPFVAIAVWAGGGHLLLSPLVFQVGAFQFAFMQHVADQLAATFPEAPGLPQRRVVLVNAPDGAFTGYLLVTRWAHGQPIPASLFPLAVGTRAVDLYRTGPRTLLVRSAGGFIQGGTELLVRDPRHRMPVGTSVRVDGDNVQVVEETADGRPALVRVTFDRPLEAPGLDWIVWTRHGFASFKPPAIGASVHIPAVSLLRWP